MVQQEADHFGALGVPVRVSRYAGMAIWRLAAAPEGAQAPVESLNLHALFIHTVRQPGA
jgi:hypothetical protein